MKDFRNKDIIVGDEVILMVPGYRSFTVGIVTRINKKKLTIEFTTSYGSKWTTYRYPNQVLRCKREGEE